MRKGGCTRHEVTSNRGCSSAVVLHIPGYIGHEGLALKMGTCTMRYGNRSVGTAHREPRITRRRCSPEPHPCSHAVSRHLFEDCRRLRASTELETRTRTPTEPHVPGMYGRIGKQLGPWSARSRTVQRLLAPLLSGWARRMQQGGLDFFKADLEGPLAGFPAVTKVCVRWPWLLS